MTLEPGGSVFLTQIVATIGVGVAALRSRPSWAEPTTPLHEVRPASRGTSPEVILWCVIVFLVGAAGRLFFLAYSAFESGDQPDYTAIARNLLRHGTFAIDPASPTMFRPPGYPAFIAGVYALFGERNQAVLVIQLLVGAAAGVLLYLWLRRLTSERSARACAVLVAAYPHLNFYAATILAETILAAILTAVVYTLYRSQREPGRAFAMMTGALAAAAALVTPRMLALPLLAAGALVLAARGHAQAGGLRKAFACLLVATAVMLPWTARNLVVFGVPSPSAVQSPGAGAWWSAKRVTMYDYTYAELSDEALFRRFRELYGNPANERSRLRERLALDREMSRAARSAILADPAGYLLDRAKKYPRLWIQPAMYAGYFHAPFTAHNAGLSDMLSKGDLGPAVTRVALTLVFVAIPALLVAVGLVTTRSEWRRHAFVYMVFAWTAVSLAPFPLEHRYSVIIHPLLALFCAKALDRLAALRLRPAGVRS